MVIRVGINGFGRIGRITFRTCFHNSEIQLAAINDPAIDIEYICYLIKFDSTHGKFREDVTHTNDEITINGQKIKVFREKLPPDVPWDKAGVQYVIEASGMFTSLDKASGHLLSEGVKRVIVTAPSVDAPMVILGVNDHLLDTGHKVISCASSTLYCLAPIIKILNDNFGVVEGFITSIHAMTPSLKPLDGLCLRGKHWRDHRSINQNIIPATTGACKALGKILPQVKDKMTGLAFRVPIINVSVLDITVKLDASTSIEEIVTCVKQASNRGLKNIISISNEDAVSSDFIGDSHSCILDVVSSLQLRPTFFKIICWYENEYSYACRVLDSIFYSEMQFTQLTALATKTTYVRAKMPKQIITPNQNGNRPMTIQCNYVTTSTDEIFGSNFNDNIKTKQALNRRSLLVRKPLLSQSSGIAATVLNQNTKRRNEIFKVWNDDCDPAKNSIRPNRNSFFHSCVSIGPKYSLQQTDCMKVQERLENVKREFSKMLIITEDLLKNSYNSKMKLQCLGSKDVMKINSNMELKVESSFNSCPEDALNIIKGSLIKSEMNNQICKDCGDFKNTVISNYSSEDRENKMEVCEGNRTDNMDNITAIEEKIRFGYDQIKKRKTETFRFKEPCKEECSIEENPTEIVGTPDIIADSSASDNTDTDAKMVNTIKSLTHAITNKVVENVFSELNLSVPLIAKKSHEDNQRHTNILNLEEDTHVEKGRSYNRKLEDKRIISKHRPDNCYNIQGLSKFLPSKSYDMHILDEELRKRNIIIMNSESKSILNVASEHSTQDIEDRRKNLDLNKKILAGLRIVAETGINDSISRCASPANTVTTISNGDRTRIKQDIYDKLDSASASDSNNSFEINERKSQVLNITDLTKSLEDLERLDKICRIIEISDELSDKLFSNLDNNDSSYEQEKKWSFKDLCERIKLDEFCNNVFGKTST